MLRIQNNSFGKNDNTGMILIVLYKLKPENCLPLQFILKNGYLHFLKFDLLVYNNSEEINIPLNENYLVVNAPQNDKLAKAYNYAWHCARELKKKWLLLLDQDAELTTEYFEELDQILNSEDTENVSAIIPQIQHNNAPFTPKTYMPELGHVFFTRPIKQSGIYHKCILSINSGTVLSIKAVEEIGGFSLKYPLDGLDTWYFYQLYKNRKNIYVMNAVLKQNISVVDYSQMTVHRYLSILNADVQFSKELGWIAVFLWKLKIPFRAIKRLLYKQERKYALLTLSYLFK